MKSTQYIQRILYGVNGLVAMIALVVPGVMSAARVEDDFEMPIDCNNVVNFQNPSGNYVQEGDCRERGGLRMHGRKGLMTGTIQKTVELQNGDQIIGDGNTESEEDEADDRSSSNDWWQGRLAFGLGIGDNDRDETDYQADTSSVSIGETLTIEAGETEGNWSLTGFWSDTPPMNGEVEKKLFAPDNFARGDDVAEYSVNPPMDLEEMTVTSSNPDVIRCDGTNGTSCETKSAGTATITVSFPSREQNVQIQRPIFDAPQWREEGESGTESQGIFFQDGALGDIRRTSTYTESFYPNNANEGYGIVAASVQNTGTECCDLDSIPGQPPDHQLHAYTFPDITYHIEVTSPNKSPEAEYEDTTNITKTKATAKWSYDDPDGDEQSKSRLQIARDENFTNIVVNTATSGSTNQKRVTGLDPGTTYYPRVKVFDNRSENTASEWAEGEEFTTAEDTTPAPQLTSFTINDQSNQLTVGPGEELSVEWETADSNRFADCNAGTNPFASAEYFWSGDKSTSTSSETGSAPSPSTDITYTHSLTCTPKESFEPIQTAQVNVTVDVNEAPEVTYQNTDNLESTQATANWTYTDNEGDEQQRYEIQVSRDGTFGNDDDLTFIGNNQAREYVMTGLSPDTTYTPRIRATDSADKQSDWSVGSEFTTKKDFRPDISGCTVFPEVISEAQEATIEVEATGGSGDPANYRYRLDPNTNDDIKSTRPTSGFVNDPDNDGTYTWRQDYENTPVGNKIPEVTVKDVSTGDTRTKECQSITYYPSRNFEEVSP